MTNKKILRTSDLSTVYLVEVLMDSLQLLNITYLKYRDIFRYNEIYR